MELSKTPFCSYRCDPCGVAGSVNCDGSLSWRRDNVETAKERAETLTALREYRQALQVERSSLRYWLLPRKRRKEIKFGLSMIQRRIDLRELDCTLDKESIAHEARRRSRE